MSLFGAYPYYHRTLERFIIAFGSLFSDITIRKFDSSGTNRLSSYTVPVEYACKDKWFSRLKEQTDLSAHQVKVTLPRIAFEMTDLRYAPTRKIGVNGNFVVGNVNGMRGRIYTPAPYDCIFNLYIATKDSSDGFQIMEQIIPYFQPYFTLTYITLPEYNITKDVPITLDSYQSDDTYDGSFEEQRLETQTFTFSAQMDFFGPTIASDAVIKQVLIGLGENFNMPTNIEMTSTVNPFTAASTDIYTIVDTLTETIE